MIKKFLNLGIQPLANRYLTKKDILKKTQELFYHLEVGSIQGQNLYQF